MGCLEEIGQDDERTGYAEICGETDPVNSSLEYQRQTVILEKYLLRSKCLLIERLLLFNAIPYG